MVFGIYRDPNSLTFPSDRIVGATPAIDVIWLNKAGTLAVGAITDVILSDGRGARLTRKAGILEIGRHPISVVYDQPMPGVDRPWFLCPVCGRRCRYVYLRDVIACRRCCCFSGPLDYASRHIHRQMPGIHRIMRWRRQIGIDLHLFGAIPDRPKHHTRYHRYAKLIRATEAQLVKYLGGINRDIERRARLRAMLPK